MDSLSGCLLYLLLTAACAVVLRRCAEERDPWLLLFASVGLAGIALILGGALLLPWLSPENGLLALGTLALLALALSWRHGPLPPLLRRSDGWWLLLAGVPGLALAAYFGLFIMSVSFGVDDGFFLHTSNIGMMLAGKYPPTSFLGEPLQGHYGKDLLTALLALTFRANFLDTEWVSTCTVQILHFAFLLCWFRVESGKASQAILGAYFAFFGSAFGEHLGLVDTIDNNNAVAYWTLTLCSYLLLRWWRTEDLKTALLAGIVLGADALIYELHFGLLGLSLFSFVLFSKRRYKGFLLLVTMALLLACVEGGAITHIARKAVVGRSEHQLDVKKAWQSQDVSLKFPKDRPFTLRRDNLRPSRFFETKLRPDGADFASSRETVPLFSKPILYCFWYPVWLAPLVLLGILKTRNRLAAWFFLLGTYSVLTPSLVSFGYFEGESARWLFGAAVGFSTSFAFILAETLSAPRPWRYGSWALLAWSVWFNAAALPLEWKEMAMALSQPGNALSDGSPGIVPNGSLLPNPRLSLDHHYRFSSSDWQVAKDLGKLGEEAPDILTARYLVNYPDETVKQGIEVAAGGMLNVVGLRTGLSGRLPAGLAGAPENIWCAPLFSQKLEARAFWAEPALWRLQDLQARWLLVDETSLPSATLHSLGELPDARKVSYSGGRSLWTFSQTAPEKRTSVRIERLSCSDAPRVALEPRKPYRLSCLLAATEAGTAWLEFRYLEEATGKVANPDDLLRSRVVVEKGRSSVSPELIGPYYPGRYRLEWRVMGGSNWVELAKLFFEERT